MNRKQEEEKDDDEKSSTEHKRQKKGWGIRWTRWMKKNREKLEG